MLGRSRIPISWCLKHLVGLERRTSLALSITCEENLFYTLSPWDGLGIVEATIFGFQHLLKRHSQMQMHGIYLLSGSDVPLVSPNVLWQRAFERNLESKSQFFQNVNQSLWDSVQPFCGENPSLQFTEQEMIILKKACVWSRQWCGFACNCIALLINGRPPWQTTWF